MPRTSPYRIDPSPSERETLESRARKYTLPFCDVLRTKIILLAAEGWPDDAIAAALSVGRDMVSPLVQVLLPPTVAWAGGAPAVGPAPGVSPQRLSWCG